MSFAFLTSGNARAAQNNLLIALFRANQLPPAHLIAVQHRQPTIV